METEKAKLLEFVSNLSEEEFNYLASRYQEIIALFEASEQPCPPGSSQLTA